MAVLALSVLGAGIGQAVGIGASVGWLAGSLLGNWLFAKGEKTQGPRLTDLTVQSSTEGVPITRVYGTIRVAGNMIWSSGILETATKKKVGGKGMGGKSTHTSYTYRASFALGLCEGPISGIRRIWADGKLIYSSGSTAGVVNIYASTQKLQGSLAIYLGTTTQAPDPTMQAYLGSDIPAFRDLAYIVFTDLQLADYGNRIPNITVEVVTSGSGAAPWLVKRLDGTAYDTVVSRPHSLTFQNGVFYDNDTSYSDETRDGTIYFTFKKTQNVLDINGNLISQKYWENEASSVSLGGIGGYSGFDAWTVQNLPRVMFGEWGGVGIEDEASEWYLDATARGDIKPYAGANFYAIHANDRMFYINGFIYGQQNMFGGSEIQPKGLWRRRVYADGMPQPDVEKFFEWQVGVHGDASAISSNSFGGFISYADNGDIVIQFNSTGRSADIFRYDADFNLVATYDYPSGHSMDTNSGVVVNGNYLMDMYFPGGNVRARLYELTEPTMTFVDEIILSSSWHSLSTKIASMGGGLAMTGEAILSMYPPLDPNAVTLKTVVDDICERAGITASHRNTTALAATTIDGYAIGRHLTGRAQIEPLTQAYFFDGVETGTELKFVMRGGTSVATLGENDLGFMNKSSSLVKVTRQLEFELPVVVNVSYLDKDNDYQPGSQSFRRIITPSDHVVDVEFSLALSSTKAAQIAEVLCLNAWTERTQFEFHTTRRYLALEPTDIVTLPNNYLGRIVSTDLADNGSILVRALADSAALYSPVAVGNDSALAQPQEISVGGPTNFFLMDIPALEAVHNRPGFYVAAAGIYTGWPGCEITHSLDDGASFESIGAIVERATVGYTTNALALPRRFNVVDRHNTITVTLSNSEDTLSSITETQLLAGQNLALLEATGDANGWEIIQFQTATLSSPGVYVLSGLMRGLFNTEAEAEHHNVGNRLIMVNPIDFQFIGRPQTEVALPALIKASTFGVEYTETLPEEFTLAGESQRPLTPLLLGCGVDRTTGSVTLRWRRRARINFWWLDRNDLELDEDTEEYRVRIYNRRGNLIRTELVTDAEELDYTKTMQETDFFGLQGIVYWDVCQNSVQVGNGNVSELQTLEPPKYGGFINMLKAMNPSLLIDTWGPSTTVINDASIYNNDAASSYTGTKAFSSTSPIVSDSALRYVTFSSGGYGRFTDLSVYRPYGDFTVLAVINFTATGATQFAFNKGTVSEGQWSLLTNSTGRIIFRIHKADGGSVDADSNTGWNDGNWHLAVGVCKFNNENNQTRTEIWVDGVLRASVPYTNTAAMRSSPTHNVGIGARGDGTGPLNGSHGPHAYFQYAMNQTMIENLYAEMIRSS